MPDNMDILREAVDQALTNYRLALAKLVVQTLMQLSAKDRKSLYRYSAGMGVWSFIRDGKDEEGYEREMDIEPEPVLCEQVSQLRTYSPFSVV